MIRKQLKAIIASFLFVTCGGPMSVIGAQYMAVSTAQLVNEAQAVVRGTVKEMKSEWNDEKNFIWTLVTFSVSQAIKGADLAGKDIELKIPGGVVGDVGQRQSDEVTFEKGEEAVVFLKTERYRAKEYFNVLRLMQGKFTVKQGKIQGKAVEDFVQGISSEMKSAE